MSETIHVGDVGTIFEAVLAESGVAVNLATATTRQLIFRRPDGTLVTKTAALTTNGTDGKMQYTTEIGFLDQAGIWFWQPYIGFVSSAWHADIHVFAVVPNLA